ncbi:hypothetical protein IQ31_00618 [Sphingobacterium siyangense]|uniref:Uncharacterized protein n=1 Tax=Sphingobacterium siyangense TaxID=459529 RepID=A0A562MYY3_9SPHI|nr:hypothetical protein IQ31_00618 [Sphingobacterium siyangense]
MDNRICPKGFPGELYCRFRDLNACNFYSIFQKRATVATVAEPRNQYIFDVVFQKKPTANVVDFAASSPHISCFSIKLRSQNSILLLLILFKIEIDAVSYTNSVLQWIKSLLSEDSIFHYCNYVAKTLNAIKLQINYNRMNY